jgi:hypothetical protein
MAQKQLPYTGGVATIGVGGTVVTVTGALDDTNCIEGDHVRDPATGYESRVLERLTVQTFRVPPWRGAALAGGAYELYPDSNLRGGYQAAVTTQLLARLSAKGLVWNLPPEFVSPTAAKWGADENQRVFSESLRTWWVMQGGAWVVTGSPYGMMGANALSEIAGLGLQATARINLDMEAFGPTGKSLAAGTDLNTVVRNGIYVGTGLVNAPDVYGSTIFVQQLSADYVQQRMCSHGTTMVYERWRINGVWNAWVPSQGVVRTQKFLASGTYVPNAFMTFAIAEGWGGGGGGGGVYSSSGNGLSGGGGGGGEYARRLFTRGQIGLGGIAVAIGAGGGGGANGGAGGQTLLTGLLSANGGTGGGYNSGGVSGAYYGYPGVGGSGGSGDFAFSGGNGSQGELYAATANLIAVRGAPGGTAACGGSGGRSVFSGYTPVAGTDGLTPGGGGSGAAAMAYPSTAPTAGGNGAPGMLVITEFCSR